jgi:AraC family transcriptional regulator
MLCALSRKKFEEILGDDLDWGDHLHRIGLDAQGSGIEFLLNRIYQELCQERFARDIAIDSYASALCVELARLLRLNERRRLGVQKGGLSPWRMQILRDRIHADAPAPRVEELSQLAGITARQLSRAFKAETGKMLGRYVDEATAERALHLLTVTEHSIKDIAAELGFANSASFAYAFRRSTGVLPSQVRRRQHA